MRDHDLPSDNIKFSFVRRTSPARNTCERARDCSSRRSCTDRRSADASMPTQSISNFRFHDYRPLVDPRPSLVNGAPQWPGEHRLIVATIGTKIRVQGLHRIQLRTERLFPSFEMHLACGCATCSKPPFAIGTLARNTAKAAPSSAGYRITQRILVSANREIAFDINKIDEHVCTQQRGNLQPEGTKSLVITLESTMTL